MKRKSAIACVVLFALPGCFGDDLRLWEPSDADVAGPGTEAGPYDGPPGDAAKVLEDGRDSLPDAPADMGAGGDAPLPSEDAERDVAKPPIDAPSVQPGVDAPGSKLADGDRCNNGGQCITGFCVDGVCCNDGCTGTCRSCRAADTGLRDGTCGPSRGGSDPDSECDATAREACGHDGSCDGAGACRNWGADVVCAAEACVSGMHASERRCDGKGKCGAASLGNCAPYLCQGTQCNTRCTSEADCIAGSFCANTMCGGKKALGEGCGGAAECASGSCADGVCCENGCTGKCSSCKFADTGRPNGTCAPVRAGTDSGGECLVADPSTCGQDGKCDGFGGCRKHVTGTTCAPAMCGNGNTTVLPARVCDGQGTCAAADAVSCGHYLCGGNQCTTTCAAHTDCAQGYYCAPNTCTLKKQPGDSCGTPDECALGFCAGGKCCSQVCTCPNPSAGNTAANAGFATNLDGWLVSGGYTNGETLSWSSEDASNCPTSGSFRIYAPQLSDGLLLEQCARIDDSRTYNFGLRARLSAPTAGGWSGGVGCRLFWADADCASILPSGIHLETPDIWVGDWQTLAWDNVVPPPGTPSVLITCSFGSGRPGPFEGSIDMIYMTPTPGRF